MSNLMIKISNPDRIAFLGNLYIDETDQLRVLINSGIHLKHFRRVQKNINIQVFDPLRNS